MSQDTDRCNTRTYGIICSVRPRRRPAEGATGPTVLVPLCVRRAGGGHGVSTSPTPSLGVERSSELTYLLTYLLGGKAAKGGPRHARGARSTDAEARRAGVVHR